MTLEEPEVVDPGGGVDPPAAASVMPAMPEPKARARRLPEMPVEALRNIPGLDDAAFPAGAPIPHDVRSPPVRIKDDAGYEALAPGTEFIAPDGTERTKPWRLRPGRHADEDYAAVPEGGDFIDPEGNTRTKPAYEDVPYTTNTLVNMATTKAQRKQILERAYPGKVREDASGEFYVDDNGTLRKPRGFTKAPMSMATAELAPIAGAVGGEFLGARVGRALPLGGTLVGSLLGSAAGAIAGHAFNEGVLALAGIDMPERGERIDEYGKTAVAAMAGSAAGRLALGAAPGIVMGWRSFAPQTVAKWLGTDLEKVEMMLSLRQQGVTNMPSSSGYTEAPRLRNVTEVMDPALRLWDPIRTSAEKHFEKKAGDILKELGVESKSPLLTPTAAVSSKEAGEAILAERTKVLQLSDALLERKLQIRQAQLASETGANTVNDQAVVKAAEESRRAAQNLVVAGFEDIERDVKRAVLVSKAGSNSGDLWEAAANKIETNRRGVITRHKLWYAQADEVAGRRLPDIGDLPQTAKQLLDSMPEGFEGAYPDLVKKIRNFAQATNPETGEVVREAVTPTFGELHNLRSELRYNVNWYAANSDFKNGAVKLLESKVDSIIHSANAVPELKLAAQLLDATDKSYGEQIKIFNARQLQTLRSGLKAGEPADPDALAKLLLREDHTDLTKKILHEVGPQIASGIRAADTQMALDNAKMITLPGQPQQYDGKKFAQEILKRYRSGMLTTVHGEEMGNKLLRQAHIIDAVGDASVPVQLRPGDTAVDVIGKMRMQVEAAQHLAKVDPMAALESEMKNVTKQHNAEMQMLRSQSAIDRVIYRPTIQAKEAADTILKSEDLLLAAHLKFGENSPEWKMLRSVYVERFFRESHGMVNQALAKVSPEVQSIMFPGVKDGTLKTLGKEMEFLMPEGHLASDLGGSLQAQAAIQKPANRMPLPASIKIAQNVPLVGNAYVAALSKYYAWLSDKSMGPTFLNWLAKGLHGDEAARQMARDEFRRRVQRSASTSTGATESWQATPEQP